MKKMTPMVDGFLRKNKVWRDEMSALREIVLDCPVTEEMKWMQPCYTYEGRNIVLIHAFKEYCALLFMKGALLKDDSHILVQQTKNVQVARQIRFTGISEIRRLEKVIKAYVNEAIAIEISGVKIPHKKTGEFEVAEEFQMKLDERPALKAAFESLTPGRQRGYLLYFAAAKQAKTREARVEKYIPHILRGAGLDD